MTATGESGIARDRQKSATESKKTGGLGVMYGHRYTLEEQEFLEKYIPGHTYKEIQAAFSEHFSWDISIGQVKGYMGNHKLNNGLTGQFPKGHQSHNKGMKGYCAAGSEKGWFKKGCIPNNHKPVGSERITKDGYVEIKVAEPSKWKLKHRVVWESANGKIPKGYIIIFRDNNKTNTDISNLLLIKRSTHATLNHTGLCEYNGEFKETAIKIAELKTVSSKAKRRSRHES